MLVLSLLAANLAAQSNAPARLALISETEETARAADLLAARLSTGAKISLLERNDIDRVRREQGMAAANRDDVRLGRILGADGLLLLDVLKTPQATNLIVRLVAVKPGVVLAGERFPWPMPDASRWPDAVAASLDAFLPKLALLRKDAVPISVVNLRSATGSAGAVDQERALKTLTIHRLSREPQIFVLERQKMAWLGEEKSLNADELAFWSGSYLLEGVVDQNGVSRDLITINARLTPPKGGTVMACEVSGPRANLAEVVNQLAAKVTALLKLKSSAPEWKPADEATNFLQEAEWALRWRLYPEAQSAADAAWALGKTDLECALVCLDSIREELFARHYWVAKRDPSGDGFNTKYVYADEVPDPANIDRAIRLMEHYEILSQFRPELLPGTNNATIAPQNAPWRDAGIKALEAVSRVLQKFYALNEWPPPMAEKLRDLRACTRSVAELISRAPTVQDAYFLGNRSVGCGELESNLGGPAKVFNCMVDWGAYWQETPEDSIALYRGLMASPVFSYLHGDLWLRGPEHPRLAAWNANDRAQAPLVWKQFVQELAASTNVLWQLEAKAFAFADATNVADLGLAFTNLYNAMFENREALAANNVEVVHATWGIEHLAKAKFPERLPKDMFEAINRLRAIEGDWDRNAAARERAAVFEKKKEYLKAKAAFQLSEFAPLFGSHDFTPAEARELQPLVAAYKSNLVARAEGLSEMDKGRSLGAISMVAFLELNLSRILNPQEAPAPPAQRPVPPRASAPQPGGISGASKPPAPLPAAADTVTNIIGVSKFLPIPLGELGEITAAGITAHHWQEGKLVLNLRCLSQAYRSNQQGKWNGTRPVTVPAIAILDPATERWRVVGCQELDLLQLFGPGFYHRTTLWHGDIFTLDGKEIKKYDPANRQWQALEILDGGNYQLFNVADHLYAANPGLIMEILEGGKSTHILASSRRRPAVSALDTEELGTPALFEGPQHSLRVCAKNRIFTWTSNDWREVCATPPATAAPTISSDGVLFVTDGWNLPPCVSHLARDSNAVTFCLGSLRKPGPGAISESSPAGRKPAWRMPPGLSLANLPAAAWRSDVFLLLDHSKTQDIVSQRFGYIIGRKALPQDGYHAALLCFTPNLPEPQRLYLRFDGELTHVPLLGVVPDVYVPPNVEKLKPWLLFGGDRLFFGLELAGPSQGETAPDDEPAKIGVWVIQQSQLEPEIAAQRQAQARQ